MYGMASQSFDDKVPTPTSARNSSNDEMYYVETRIDFLRLRESNPIGFVLTVQYKGAIECGGHSEVDGEACNKCRNP
jgi:hypothetical protein